MTKLAILSAAALMMAGGSAYAMQSNDAHAMAHGQHGKHMAGASTKAEATAMAEARFAKMDVNSDGVFDAADRTAMMEKRFAKLDADSNGEISQAEMTAAHETRMGRKGDATSETKAGKRMGAKRGGMNMADHFAMLDTDKSGGLSTTEMAAARAMHGKMGRRANAGNDRSISRADFLAMTDARFARVDTDGNGTISSEERAAARDAMKAKRSERRAARQSGA